MREVKEVPGTKQAARTARLAEELRANLLRRKAQARSRRSGDTGEQAEVEAPSAADTPDREQR